MDWQIHRLQAVLLPSLLMDLMEFAEHPRFPVPIICVSGTAA